MPIERYIRCSVDIPDGSVEIGLQYTAKPDVQRDELRQIVTLAYLRVRVEFDMPLSIEALADVMTPILEESIRFVYPGRAWFVEVWDATQALTQVYHRWLP